MGVSDHELTQLLSQVYVGGGFTELETAGSLFDPSVIRVRGRIIAARDITTSMLAGIVIVVSPDSAARRFAQDNETEMHLLGVSPDYRRHGLGRQLVEAAIDDATNSGCSKMLLWTQTTMYAAHSLYEACGFVRTKERDFRKNGRDFWFYERTLCAQ